MKRNVNVNLGVKVGPAYGEGYYAVFFADPDGIKLEFVHLPRTPRLGFEPK